LQGHKATEIARRLHTTTKTIHRHQRLIASLRNSASA
jgi:DNA-binding NarL/FixJ family response regulator